MRKRGGIGLNYYAMLGLALVAIFLIIMYDISDSVMSKEIPENIYLARDTALLIDTLQATPNDVFYTYPAHFDSRQITINQSIVQTTRLGERPAANEKHWFKPSNMFQLIYPNTIPAYYFDMYKLGNVITIGSNIDPVDTVSEETFLRADTKIKVTYDSSSLQKTLLKSFSENIKAAMQDQGLETVTSQETIELRIQNKADKFTIYYSQVNQQETKTLANKIRTFVPENIFTRAPIPTESTKPLVIIDFKDLSSLEDVTENKRLAVRVGAAFAKVYI